MKNRKTTVLVTNENQITKLPVTSVLQFLPFLSYLAAHALTFDTVQTLFSPFWKIQKVDTISWVFFFIILH